MGDTTYNNWKARLQGAAVSTHDGDPDVGFYRKPIRTSREEGHKITGWEPVAYFMDGGKIVGVIGDRDMTDNEVADLWTYVCQYPVPEMVYREVADHGTPWPRDLIGEPKATHRTAYPEQVNGNGRNRGQVMTGLSPQDNGAIPTATEGRTVTTTDNAPPVVVPKDQEIGEKIENAVKFADTFKAMPIDKLIEKLDEAAGARNRLLELKREAENTKEELFRPYKDAADKVAKLWNPIIAKPETAAKALYQAILKAEQKKRDDAAAAEAAAKAEQERLDEQHIRQTDRAIERGEPAPPPPVVEAPATPAPTSSVKATYGRATPMIERTFVVIADLDEVFKHFKTNTEVIDLLTRLAQADVTAGLTVPGTTTRRGLV